MFEESSFLIHVSQACAEAFFGIYVYAVVRVNKVK